MVNIVQKTQDSYLISEADLFEFFATQLTIDVALIDKFEPDGSDATFYRLWLKEVTV